MLATDPRSVIKRIMCWHKPKFTTISYQTYECEKCGYLHADAKYGVTLRCLWWLITERLPRRGE